jgi:hypothetical protein
VFAPAQEDMNQVLLMTHSSGITLEGPARRLFPNSVEHDPHDLAAARALADRSDVYAIGLFYRNESAARYDEYTSAGIDFTPAQKVAAVNRALDRFMI